MQENYIGFLIEYWIEVNKRELSLFKTDIDIKKVDVKSKLTQLENEVDKKKYPIEYEGRKKVITENLDDELKIRIPKFEKNLEEVKKILTDGNNLTIIEISELKQLQSDLNLVLNNYKTLD